MAMSNDEILSARTVRSGKTSRATFRGREAQGPIIDQEGREIPAESLGPQVRSFRFEFGNARLGCAVAEPERQHRITAELGDYLAPAQQQRPRVPGA